MKHIKLKSLINESYISSSPFAESLNKDLKHLEQKLIEEGLWDVIKQKVGDANNKTKEILLKPLIKLVVDKIAKDDPQGFYKLQQYAEDKSKIKDLLNHSDIKKKQSELEKEVASVKESLSEAEYDNFIQEYIDDVLNEASVLRNEPKKTNLAKVDKFNLPQSKNEESSTRQNIKQGLDKLGIAAIEKGGDIMAKAMGGASKRVQALVQTDTGKAVGGLIGKIYQWAKDNPKITATAGIALLGLIGTAAAIGSGGIAPLIATTISAAGSGALKGAAVGSAIGTGKEMYSQIKGGTKSFKDMDYKKVGKAAAKTGAKGAAIGAAVGAGANVLGKAALGAADVASGQYGKAIDAGGDGPFRDLTPGEKRNLGLSSDGSSPVTRMPDKQWAGQYDPNDMKTWKIKPSINSTQGYNMAYKENELLYKAITGKNIN